MTTTLHYNIILLSYKSIIITQNNLIHRFYKMVTYTLHITNNVDTRDPIGSNLKILNISNQYQNNKSMLLHTNFTTPREILFPANH